MCTLGTCPRAPNSSCGPQNLHLGCGFGATQSGFQQHPDSGAEDKTGGRVFSAGRGCQVCFCIPHHAAAYHLGFLVFFLQKPPLEHSTPRGGLAAAVFSGPPSSLKTLWVSFSRLSSCCCHAGGRRKLLSPTPGPYSGASNLPLSRGWEPQCTKDPGDPGAPWLAGSGKQAAVGWQGFGSRVGRGSWWKRGKGSCQADILWEGGGAANGAFGQLLLGGWDGAVGRSSRFFTALVRHSSASDPACREPPPC